MNSKLFFGLIILVAGMLVGWYVFGGSVSTMTGLTGSSQESPTPTLGAGTSLDQQESSAPGQMMDKGGIVSRSVVTYTDTGFAPSTVTVKQGSIVTFVNESTGSMWVASAMHPTHQLLPGFDQKASVASGGTYEYTFTNVGTWKYHNHQNPEDTATVVVTQ